MTTLQFRNSINLTHWRRGFALVPLALACFALSSSAFAQATSTKWTQIGTGARAGIGAIGVDHNICGCIIQAAWSYDNVAQNRNVLWMGTASGGLWKSKVDSNGNIKKWIPLTENFPGPHGMGSFIVNRTDSNKILIGPGGFGAGSEIGDGKIYRTSDQGSKWTGYTLPQAKPTRINRIVEDRSDPTGNTVLASTSNGIYRSITFGETFDVYPYALVPAWTRTSISAYGDDLQVTDIVQDTGNPKIWYAAALIDHAILRSTNGGLTWDTWGKSFPNGTNPIKGSIGRVSLAACAADPKILYALVATEKGTNDDPDEPDGGLLNGLWRSLNRGKDWTAILTDSEADNNKINSDNQALHTCAIACDPSDPGHIIFGMRKPLEAFNATNLVPALINWRTLGADGESNLDGGHDDYNFFLFRPGFSNIVIENDGGYYTYTPTPFGFSLLDDSGNLLGIEANYITTKVQQGGLASSHRNPAEFLAGVQHNGILRGNATTGRVTRVYGGDGGQVSIMPLNSDVLAGCDNKRRLVFLNSVWSDITLGLPDDKYPSVLIDPTPGITAPKMFTYAQTLVGFSYVYFRRVDTSSNWQFASTVFDALPGVATYLDHTTNPNRHDILVTLQGDRHLFMYTGKRTDLELGALKLVDISPPVAKDSTKNDANANADKSALQPDTIYYTTGKARPSRAWLSTDGGKGWKNVTAAGLPTDSSGPDFNKLIGNPHNLKDLFLATSAGVYRTDSNGNWQRYSTGLRLNEDVRDIAINIYNVAVPTLYIATMGRGFWQRAIQ